MLQADKVIVPYVNNVGAEVLTMMMLTKPGN